jgi:uncharacterized protein YndB with AHSA1/START domain
MTDFDPDDPSARVSRHEVVVPGSPEQVWQAVATGAGISTWFVPTEVDEQEGGRIFTDHGPYGTSEGVVVRWDPPHRFGYQEAGWNPADPDAPPWATELLVTGRDGGSCVVRLVSGFFTGGEGWEKHLDGADEGWASALRNLRWVLTYFPGRPGTALLAAGTVIDRAPDDVGRDFLRAAGLRNVTPGQRVQLGGAVPATAGTVVHAGSRSVTLRTDEPHSGIVEFGVFDHGGAAVLVRGYLFGAGASDAAEREARRWSSWLTDTVPGLVPLT